MMAQPQPPRLGQQPRFLNPGPPSTQLGAVSTMPELQGHDQTAYDYPKASSRTLPSAGSDNNSKGTDNPNGTHSQSNKNEIANVKVTQQFGGLSQKPIHEATPTTPSQLQPTKEDPLTATEDSLEEEKEANKRKRKKLSDAIDSELEANKQGRVNESDKNGTDVNKDEAVTSHESDRACLLYTSPSPRDATLSRMPSSA